MKIAVSIPDEVYEQADEIAERLGWSRSQLYTNALRQFLDAQGDDPVTAVLDALAGELGTVEPPSAGRALIEAGAWEW